MSLRRILLALAASSAVLSSPVRAQDPESVFHHAYFLERERGQLEDALKLYEQVAEAREASAALQGEAAKRAAGVREDLASVDLARLMPADTVLYAEFDQPGQALETVLRALGLLGNLQDALDKHTLAISPELLRGLFGIRGAAVALTRLPVEGQEPGGVLVLHAGEVGTLRGLLETAIPIEGKPADAIDGVPVWVLHDRLHVALTPRLLVAATDRDEIAGVLRRLHGQADDGFASNPAMAAHLARRNGGPLFCCLNATPVKPMLRALVAQQSAANPEVALLAAAFDVESLEAVVLRLAVGEEGVALEGELDLAADHRNLVFNLLRPAPLDPATLDLVPEGVAAFLASALNERGPALAPLDENSNGAPVVTAMDFGRELFANLAGIALYVMPGGAPLPKAALVLSSNDPARTRAVLDLLLGFANLAAGGGSLAPQEDQIAGMPAQVFRLPPGIPLYLATQENRLILAADEELIESALDARTSGHSVLHDPAFAAELGGLGKDTTFALCAHVGRSLAVAQPFLPPDVKTEVARYAPLLEHTVLGARSMHGNASLGFALTLHGLPDIGGLVTGLIQKAHEHGGVAARSQPAEDGLEGLCAAFDKRARAEGVAGARAFVRHTLEQRGDEARALNNFAWSLLSEDEYGQRYDALALEVAALANERSGYSTWQYLDTLALAKFRCGAVDEAIELEERALRGVGDSAPDRADVQANLARFRAASRSPVAATAPR